MGKGIKLFAHATVLSRREADYLLVSFGPFFLYVYRKSRSFLKQFKKRKEKRETDRGRRGASTGIQYVSPFKKVKATGKLLIKKFLIT